MSNQIKGGIAVVGVVAAAAVVGFLFTRDITAFAGNVKARVAGTSVESAASASGAMGQYFGTPFTKESLTSAEKAKVFEAEQQVYSAYEELLGRRYLNEFFSRYMKEKNLKTIDEARDHYAKENVNVPEARIQAILQQYKDDPRLKSLSPEQQVKEVRNALEGQARQEVIGRLIQNARAKGEVALTMPRPVEPRLDITDGGSFFMGPKEAKVTIIEFADYQCPYCARMVPTLMDVMKKYDGKVRWVYRDFPLDFHQNAKPAAVSAKCAGDQGKYFEAHNFLFEHYSNLGEEVYTKLATELKLDKAKFEQCRKDPATLATVMANYQTGVDVGVNGTPAYYINGRKLSGGQSVNDFSHAIDEELKAN